MAEGTIHYAEAEGTGVLRFAGEIRYTLANALNRFLDELFAKGEFKSLLVDLSQVDSIDSTGLGLLAKIANFVRQRDGVRPLLFSSRPDINAVLTSICLDDAFVLCDRGPEGPPGEALAPGDPTEAELGRTVLEAHRLLCAMNESNRAQFLNVVEAFERDLGQA